MSGWVAQRLQPRGLELVGPAEQPHLRPWATVLRFPTGDGDVWFKACATGTAYEVPLLESLSRWAGDRVVVPLATDPARGWLLMADGGTTLRSSAGQTDLAGWERLLTEYAELQRLSEAHTDELLAAGVPDLRPEQLPQLLERLLADPSALGVGLPEGPTPEQLRQISDLRPTIDEWCAQLAAFGVQPTLQHDDLHDANAFVPSGSTPHFRVFDWGDSSVAVPFTSLLVSLRVVANKHRLPAGAPELLRLRDAYLEAWTATYDVADLREACRLATHLGPISRSDCYRRALLDADEAAAAEWADAVGGWLLELLEPSLLDEA